MTATHESSELHHDDGDDLINVKDACCILGGKAAPLHQSTLYRGIASGRYPKPIKIGPKTNRWSRSEIKSVLRAMAEKRDQAA
ncbi:MAG TPA: AlpA family phage regulatory protein [Rhizomicrobium sp.]|jgi:predicted DNA-binding transcriptional regulator AlpA|nr:AlpA family phage regulatory protein [Rhizomicrobium sp.]